MKPDGHGAKGLSWHHGNCFMKLFPSIQVEKLHGWESLSDSDQAEILDLVKKVPSAAKSGINVNVVLSFVVLVFSLRSNPSSSSFFFLWLG